MIRVLIFLFTSLVNSSYAKIITINSITDYKHQSAELYVFDLDNTLFTTKSQIGGDQWFSYRIKNAKTGLEKQKIISLYNFLQSKVRVLPTEPEMLRYVNSLDPEKLVFLTARGTEIVAETKKQLREAGYSKAFDRVEIINSANKPKGQLLKAYLHKKRISGTVIMFDDKAYNLESCESYNRDINFIGYRYSYMDQAVKDFDPEIADLQEKYMFEILPDELASELISKNRSKKLGKLSK